ncbi:TFC1 Transcription factor tau 95 kDa subunit [Candida maltosa Xu316]
MSAIDLPLNVQNTDRAINMLGGVPSIRNSIRENQPLELRLRKDPFHHPVQASSSNAEKILLKIRIPKRSLPPNADQIPIRELLKINNEDKSTPKAIIQPISIIDKTYSFKAISDFQVSTKNNQFVQQYNKAVLNYQSVDDVKNYVDENGGWYNSVDFPRDYFENIDHQMIPPPILSPIRFPFDYKYQKNPATVAVKNDRGELKMISSKHQQKLYTILIDFNSPCPKGPLDQIKKNWARLQKENIPVNSSDFLLVRCINQLKDLFEIKPIWNRKQLQDILPEELKKYLKHALPYVSFFYKSGPWRFCNIKYGIDVMHEPSYWPYQTEYFRVAGLKSVPVKVGPRKITPPTLIEAEDEGRKVEVAENLLFNGVTLPSVTTFQIGDIMDSDIMNIIEEHKDYMGDEFLRETCDSQDGWVNKQTMEVIRRIMRYKLSELIKDKPFDEKKILKILTTDYSAEKGQDDDVNGPDEAGDEDLDDEDDGEDEDEEESDADDTQQHETSIDENEQEILGKLKQLDTDTYDTLNKLVGFVKQDSITDV